jgi:hypothetical protein
MDRSEQKSFFRWLDSASDRELQQRLLALESISYRLTEPDVIGEFNWIKGKVLEEMDARKQCDEMSARMLESPAKEIKPKSDNSQ